LSGEEEKEKEGEEEEEDWWLLDQVATFVAPGKNVIKSF
jgi:hypothetical protein